MTKYQMETKRDWFLCLLVSETLVCALLAPCKKLWQLECVKERTAELMGTGNRARKVLGTRCHLQRHILRWPISSKKPQVSQTCPTVPSTGHKAFNTWSCGFPIQNITWPDCPVIGEQANKFWYVHTVLEWQLLMTAQDKSYIQYWVQKASLWHLSFFS